MGFPLQKERPGYSLLVPTHKNVLGATRCYP